jgi:hypothetical protein
MEIRDGGAYYVSPADALLSGSTSDFAPAILSAATKFGVRIITFTISGALQRFDDRRQLVLQEVTAVTTADDHLGLFEGGIVRELQNKLKEYGVSASWPHSN